MIPLGIVAWILVRIGSYVFEFHTVLPEQWQPQHFLEPLPARFLNLVISIGILFGVLILVSLLGWLSKRYLGRLFLRTMSHFIERIPVVRSIYSSLNQLINTMASSEKNQFSRVIYVRYPHRDSFTLAFVTASTSFQGNPGYLHVYVPTTPNPTSGFFLVVKETDTIESGLSVEEAFKTIFSLGIAGKEELPE